MGSTALMQSFYMSKMAMLNENVNEMNCVCKCVMKCYSDLSWIIMGACKCAFKEVSVCMHMKIIPIYHSI